ncbi:unnamed protein product [Cylindrotheca closterium]|uniref:Circumsporozoite protein n=1 Tax=Cylindrotheca closterium TaxID=2856 RepID=A0AAD2FD52_9STRA|nr:unnamed protein product [Cylindrotheca closterium]
MSQLPSKQPSFSPSISPSRSPSAAPSGSMVPSKSPSRQPTNNPSSSPSKQPSLAPSKSPSNSNAPSFSKQPSSKPSESAQPSVSRVPSRQPSSNPTNVASGSPTSLPSQQPSSAPSAIPSTGPTSLPSLEPSKQPSAIPSQKPSSIPSLNPSILPSISANPTSFAPTISKEPSMVPSIVPSKSPSTVPSDIPSIIPSFAPSQVPSTVPSRWPSMVPSTEPSMEPSFEPSIEPTITQEPSTYPTPYPSAIFSLQRTATVAIEIGINGLNNLDIVCEGIGNFLNSGIQGVYGSDTMSAISCSQQGLGRRSLVGNDNIFRPPGGVGVVEEVFDYEKPVLITVVTTFDNYKTAPRQFGYADFLEQLLVSDRAQEQLPQYIQNAVGGLVFIEGVHVRLVFTPKKPIILLGFGADSPTPSPTSNGTTTLDVTGNDNNIGEEGGDSPSGVKGIQSLWPLVICLIARRMVTVL